MRRPLEASRGLELERTEGPWHLDLLLSLTCSRQKFEWGLPRLGPHANPRSSLGAGHLVPGPWCGWLRQAFLESRSRAAPDKAIRVLEDVTPHPAGCMGGPVGGGAGFPACFSGDLRAVTALSGAPGFFCPARRAPEPARREQGWGVVFGAPRRSAPRRARVAGKSRLRTSRDVQEF